MTLLANGAQVLFIILNNLAMVCTIVCKFHKHFEMVTLMLAFL